jgi:hypothetical protein
MAIVIGLALQSTLSDVFSGIVLNTTRPYQIGDLSPSTAPKARWWISTGAPRE